MCFNCRHWKYLYAYICDLNFLRFVKFKQNERGTVLPILIFFNMGNNNNRALLNFKRFEKFLKQPVLDQNNAMIFWKIIF